MTNRRSFLQKLSIGLATPGLLAVSDTSSKIKEIDNSLNGEEFWNSVRKQFPLTNDRIYFNNGTFGPSPYPVLDGIKNAFDASNTTAEYGHTDEARKRLAEFVGVKMSEISLTHNTTEGINIVTWGLSLERGDEVIVTLHEHVGNALPWLNRAKLDGIVLKPFEPGNTKQENIDRIEQLITPRTRVIAIPHVTCTTGLVFPIKEISELAKQHNILTAIDGAHGSGTFDLNLKELGCDFYATCCHKWMLGPNGTGFLYIKEKLLDLVQAYQVGAYSDTGWDLYHNPPKLNGYVPTAHRFDYGSQSMPMYAGAAASADFHSEIGKSKIEARVRELNAHLYNGLKELYKGLELLTPEESESRISMVTFKPNDWDYRAFAREVNKEGFRIRVVPESNLEAIRISTHIYNSIDEIDHFLGTLEGLIKF